MRRLLFRALLLAALTVGVVGVPGAVAQQKVPGSCDLVKNTVCHCLSPQGLMECTTMP